MRINNQQSTDKKQLKTNMTAPVLVETTSEKSLSYGEIFALVLYLFVFVGADYYFSFAGFFKQPAATKVSVPTKVSLPSKLPLITKLPESSEFGKVYVKSIPAGACIFVDGKDTGQKTNSIVKEIAVEKPEISLKFPRYKTGFISSSLNAQEDQLSRPDVVRLVPDWGTFWFQVSLQMVHSGFWQLIEIKHLEIPLSLVIQLKVCCQESILSRVMQNIMRL